MYSFWHVVVSFHTLLKFYLSPDVITGYNVLSGILSSVFQKNIVVIITVISLTSLLHEGKAFNLYSWPSRRLLQYYRPSNSLLMFLLLGIRWWVLQTDTHTRIKLGDGGEGKGWGLVWRVCCWSKIKRDSTVQLLQSNFTLISHVHRLDLQSQQPDRETPETHG